MGRAKLRSRLLRVPGSGRPERRPLGACWGRGAGPCAPGEGRPGEAGLVQLLVGAGKGRAPLGVCRGPWVPGDRMLLRSGRPSHQMRLLGIPGILMQLESFLAQGSWETFSIPRDDHIGHFTDGKAHLKLLSQIRLGTPCGFCQIQHKWVRHGDSSLFKTCFGLQEVALT
jgi:hypothetical protein